MFHKDHEVTLLGIRSLRVSFLRSPNTNPLHPPLVFNRRGMEGRKEGRKGGREGGRKERRKIDR